MTPPSTVVGDMCGLSSFFGLGANGLLTVRSSEVGRAFPLSRPKHLFPLSKKVSVLEICQCSVNQNVTHLHQIVGLLTQV